MFKRIAITAVLAAALMVPASAAATTSFLPPFSPVTPHARAAYVAATGTVVATAPGGSSGFAWGDAALGAVVMLALVGTVSLVVLAGWPAARRKLAG